MNMQRKWKLNNRGTSMIVAVVIITILMIFCFSLLLASYTLYSSQNKKAASKRNSEAANTLSVALEKELTSDSAEKDSALWKYLRCNLIQDTTWPDYRPGVDGHTKDAYRYFDLNYNYHKNYFEGSGLEGLEGFPGKVELCVYWMLPDGVILSSGQNVSEINPNGTRLFVEIHCETASQTYIVTNEYVLSSTQYGGDNASKTRKKRLQTVTGISDTYNPMHNPVNADQDWTWTFVGRE